MSQLILISGIAAGGAIGACSRYGVSSLVTQVTGGSNAWGTFAVNVIGSLFMGILIAAYAHLGNPSQEMRAFFITGFLGALTTFSTFSLDAIVLIERHAYLEAFLYIAGSIVVCLAAVFIGLWLIRGLAA